MTERELIDSEIQANLKKIIQIRLDVIELRKKQCLICDEKQWFREQVESHPKSRWQRLENELNGKLIGRIYWNESFQDQDTKKIVSIERSEIVRIDGEWTFANQKDVDALKEKLK
jgi:uncharacterized protein YchJ